MSRPQAGHFFWLWYFLGRLLSMVTATVAYFVRDRGRGQEILLGIKTRRVCRNKRLGPGGKRKNRETYRACAVREIREEVGVDVEESDLEYVALIDFSDRQPDSSYGNGRRVAFYLVRKWVGRFHLNGELRNLRWYKLSEAPIEKMMLGDPLWFQAAVSGYFVRGAIRYGNSRRKVDSFRYTIEKTA